MKRNRSLAAVLAALLMVSAAVPAAARERVGGKKHVGAKARIAGVLLGALGGFGLGYAAGKVYYSTPQCDGEDACIYTVLSILAVGTVGGAVTGFFVSGAIANGTDRALDEGREKVRLAHAERAARARRCPELEPPAPAIALAAYQGGRS